MKTTFISLSKNIFSELLQAEKNSLLNCCERVKLEHALLIVLNFLGNQNTIKDISAEFNLPKSCTHSIISSGKKLNTEKLNNLVYILSE